GCNSLETIKLPKLNEGGKIITSDDENKNPLFGFMNGCNKVHDIDFKPFMNLETIPIGFFGQLMPSNYLAFEKFADLKLEAQHFFNEYEMDAINLLPLTNVEEIKNDFLNACTNAKNIILPFSPDLAVIGKNFLANCKKLQTIDLTNLKELYTLGNHAFRNCESLTELDISDLKSISAIQPGFARNCVSLAKLNIGELTADIFVEDDTYDAMYSFALDSKVEDYTGIKIIVAKEWDGVNRKNIQEKFADNWDQPAPQFYWRHWA
ncbi:MAG: leucine-rich repeat protein, partial [Malacoplasma sp.]|nr:leucine-rich repeat protein [Malacoplasma sp.]